MLKQMKYENISGKQCHRRAETEAASTWRCWSDDAKNMKLHILLRVASQILDS